MKIYNTIALIIIISGVFFTISWNIWVYFGFIFKKGDPVIAPYFKKTYYHHKTLVSNYDFNPFFNKIQKNLENNKTIDYYEWILYYNSNKRFFYKAEFIVYHKIGVKNCKLLFQSKQTFFVDKTKTIHLSVDLIFTRWFENVLAGEIYKKNNKSWNENNSVFKTVYDEKNQDFLGYNINQGAIRYKILIDEDDC